MYSVVQRFDGMLALGSWGFEIEVSACLSNFPRLYLSSIHRELKVSLWGYVGVLVPIHPKP